MINTTNIEEAKKLLKKEETPKIVLSQNDEFNRKILEHGKFDILLSPETGQRKNKIRQTDSGLNHVLAKIANKNNLAIGLNLEEIKKLEPKSKAERLSKIRQNIKICRKAKTKLAIKTSSIEEAMSLLQNLGASTQQAKEAIVF
ncbi:hypothetical protein J4423_00695 [Candidatus Pacearchaeota archaeon]|nr:hypothetical protein [Candidatus Pacearchaeota archaeon]